MSNNFFRFKQFTIFQEKAAMKVGVDSVLLGSCASFENPDTIMDIGTGTGLLAFMSHQRTGAHITAVEIDSDAFEQCIENVKFNNCNDKIHVIHSSIQEFAYNSNELFDHIICNPPYFNNTYGSADLKRNTARQNMMLTAEELFKAVKKLLSDNGIFSIIIPFENVKEYMQLSVRYSIVCFKRIRVFPKKEKLANRCILEFSKLDKIFEESDIYVRESDTNEYTRQYKLLTKDFYLPL